MKILIVSCLTLLLSTAFLSTTWLGGVAWAEDVETDEVDRVGDRNPSKSTDPREMDAAASAEGTAGLQVVRQEPYGAYLVDADGRAVYLFTKDTGTPTCTDACAQAWPPVTTEGEARALDDAVREPLVDTMQHPSGATQVTYAGHPLYYFARDAGPGETRGQDVHGFGGGWYLISPTGEKVEANGGEPQAHR